MRPIWSGILSFGLINVPVRLYSASQSHDFNLDMLHKKDLGKIHYKYVCSLDGEEVSYKDIVKGYEYQKGEYVVLNDEDFERARSPKSRAIEIEMFTYEREIDPIYFEKPYFLEPDKDAAKAFQLLREALLQSEKVAVATFVLRNRKHLGLIKPYENGLVLIQLRYNSEIRDAGGLNIPQQKANEKETGMAIKLIDQLTQPFDPKAYKDNYKEEIQAVVEGKLKGKKFKKEQKQIETTASNDILSKLKASLDQPKRTKRIATSSARIKRTAKR